MKAAQPQSARRRAGRSHDRGCAAAPHRRQPRRGRRDADRLRGVACRRHRSGPAPCRDLHGRAWRGRRSRRRPTTPRWPWHVVVRTSDPVTACLASQYAGWSLQREPGRRISPPSARDRRARSRAGSRCSTSSSMRESADRAVLVLETDTPPPRAIVEKVVAGLRRPSAPARRSSMRRPRSLAGSVQIAARVVEVALHKAHALKFPLDRIVDAVGSAPLSPPHPDFATGMGRTNDSIIFGGSVQLFVSGPEAEAKALAEKLPSSASRDYGAPFARDLPPQQRRFLRHRPDAVQPGRSHRDGARNRRDAFVPAGSIRTCSMLRSADRRLRPGGSARAARRSLHGGARLARTHAPCGARSDAASKSTPMRLEDCAFDSAARLGSAPRRLRRAAGRCHRPHRLRSAASRR